MNLDDCDLPEVREWNEHKHLFFAAGTAIERADAALAALYEHWLILDAEQGLARLLRERDDWKRIAQRWEDEARARDGSL
jgi:hypothetical protein